MANINKINSKPNRTGLKRSFSLQSRKVQFFVIIIIVAILGGGYMVYRSYAARGEWAYSLGNGYIQLREASRQVGETKKNGKAVAEVNPGGKITVSVPGTVYPAIPAGQKMRFCVIANTNNPLLQVFQADSSGKNKFYGGATLASLTTFSTAEAQSVGAGYTKICTYKRQFNAPLAGPITIVNKGSQIRISEAIIQFVE